MRDGALDYLCAPLCGNTISTQEGFMTNPDAEDELEAELNFDESLLTESEEFDEELSEDSPALKIPNSTGAFDSPALGKEKKHDRSKMAGGLSQGVHETDNPSSPT